MELASALDQKQELLERIERATQLMLFLDFDGTLAPIVERPVLAELPGPAYRVLKNLQIRPWLALSFVSGRSLEDLKSRVGLEGAIYAGNHGLEIEGPGLRFDHPQALRLKSGIRDFCDLLSSSAAALAGVEVECKGLTASVHYRRASAVARRKLLGMLRDLVPPDDEQFVVRGGHMVYEIRPCIAWNKGHAIRWIRNQLGMGAALPIVMGDDVTDEDAFVAFDDAISVCVNPCGPTAANYSLKDPDEVREFLTWLAQRWTRSSR
jgi:trehalose 6-phosphate phosphatase